MEDHDNETGWARHDNPGRGRIVQETILRDGPTLLPLDELGSVGRASTMLPGRLGIEEGRPKGAQLNVARISAAHRLYGFAQCA